MRVFMVRVMKCSFFILGLAIAGCGGVGLQNIKKAEVVEARRNVFSVEAEPNQLFLLLPLTDKALSASAQAIRNGFLAAYYQDRNDRPHLKIKMIDTTGRDIREVYQQVVNEGAEVIVGPLTKKNVELLAADQIQVPTIALNTLDDYTNNYAANFYQFGLLPQDEATQAAAKMVQSGISRAAVIAPSGSWGDKVVMAFKGRYEDMGGEVVATLNYNSTANLAEQICPFLAEDADELCVPKLKKERGDNAKKSTRRQDINGIFLVANSSLARQIVPLLKFYYAGDLPTYSISSIYSGVNKPDQDQDVDGVYFCDMPWVLQDPSYFSQDLQEIYRQIAAANDRGWLTNKRLYALGIDAYKISSRLNEFFHNADYGMNGASGRLYLDSFNHIYRDLVWAKMQNGVPIVM